MIEAVVFDLDGTLVNLPINYEELVGEFKEIMHMENVRPLVDTVSRVDDETRKKVFRAWDKAELAVSAKITVNDEGVKVYREYAEKPKALVTLQGRKVVDAVVTRFGLAFDVVVTRENSLFRAEQLRTAAEKLGVQMENVLFAGNADGDAVAAEKVGCQFLRVK
jgi:phosphoglycolate phosphatase-like HAD superfamily hydrolase